MSFPEPVEATRTGHRENKIKRLMDGPDDSVRS